MCLYCNKYIIYDRAYKIIYVQNWFAILRFMLHITLSLFINGTYNWFCDIKRMRNCRFVSPTSVNGQETLFVSKNLLLEQYNDTTEMFSERRYDLTLVCADQAITTLFSTCSMRSVHNMHHINI